MNGGFGGRGNGLSESHLGYSLPNGSNQSQYAHSSSGRRAIGVQDGGGPPGMGTNFMGREGSDRTRVQTRGGSRGRGGGRLVSQKAGQGSYARGVYDMNGVISRQMGAKELGSMRMGTGRDLQIGLHYGDVQQAGASSTGMGALQESSINLYNMEVGYGSGGYSGSVRSQGSVSSANPQYIDMNETCAPSSYVSSQSLPRPVTQVRSVSHPRTQSQPRPMSQNPHNHQTQLQNQQYLHSQQQYMQAFPQSQSQSQVQYMSQATPESQAQYYSHTAQSGGVQQPSRSNPRAHSRVHSYSQGASGLQTSSHPGSGEQSRSQRYSSSSSLHSGVGTTKASSMQQDFQSYSSSSIGHGIATAPSSMYSKDDLGVGAGAGAGDRQYRQKPCSQQSYKHISHQPSHSGVSSIHSNPPTSSYSQGPSGGVSGSGEMDSILASQSVSSIGFRTSNVDLGIFSFQVNVPNNISDELRDSIIRLIPKEQLNNVFFLVSSLLCKNIQFRDFHARLIVTLRSSQLVDILENMLRDYFQQGSSSLAGQSTNNSQGFPESRGQVSHPIISQTSGGRSESLATSQSQYAPGVLGSNSQVYDSAILSSMASHPHSKKSISRHGGHYNMHAKEDVLQQMLRHARSRSVANIIGIDITGPSSHLSRLISAQDTISKSIILEEESIPIETLKIWTERLNNYGRYLLSCDNSLNLNYESLKEQEVPGMGKIVKFEIRPDPNRPIFSPQAIKTIHRLASFYIRDILKLILDEEGANNEKLIGQDLSEEEEDPEETKKPRKRVRQSNILTSKRSHSRDVSRADYDQMSDIEDIKRARRSLGSGPGSDQSSSSPCNFGMGKSIGGKGLGMKLNSSGNVSTVKPVMITSLWSCIYKSLRYNMSKYNACEPNAFHNVVIENYPGRPKEQCSSYILIPESMYRCVESWLLSNAYNQWDRFSIL